MTAAYSDEVKSPVITTEFVSRKIVTINTEEIASGMSDEENELQNVVNFQRNMSNRDSKEFAEVCEKLEIARCKLAERNSETCDVKAQEGNTFYAPNQKVPRVGSRELIQNDKSLNENSSNRSCSTDLTIRNMYDTNGTSNDENNIQIEREDFKADSSGAIKKTLQNITDTKPQQYIYSETTVAFLNCSETDVETEQTSSAKSYESSRCIFDRNAPLKDQLKELERSIEINDANLYDVDTSPKESSTYNIHVTNEMHCVPKTIPNIQIDDEYDPEDELSFHEAVRAGDAKSIESMIVRGLVQNLDEPDWNVSGDPPLLVAATNHCLPVLSTLLMNGCDPAVRSPRGETALHRVIQNGGPANVLKFVEELLKYGCPSSVKEAGGGLTALHVLTRQLAHAQGSKSLHHNFEEALKTLDMLAKAGPINARDHQGRSALHILVSSSIFDNNHQTEIESLIRTLLDAGADPALKNDRGETPLHECLECGALNTALLLMPHTPVGITSRYGETPLHIAARKNHLEIVARLLKHGEDPGVQDAGGNTPLHLASARGFHQTVSLFVTSPLAQLEKVNDEGLTSLQVAAESGFVNAVRLLLNAGADPSQTAHYCMTTLQHRHPDISVLIDHELTRRRQLAA